MRLKKIYLFLIPVLILFLAHSCTDEENLMEFQSSYRNESGTTLTIRAYSSNNELVYQYELSNNSSSPSCSIESTNFLGTSCGADSLLIRFDNGIGYVCSTRINNSQNLCFPNDKSPIGGTDEETYYREISENSFEFIITQEDFENALDLPE